MNHLIREVPFEMDVSFKRYLIYNSFAEIAFPTNIYVILSALNELVKTNLQAVNYELNDLHQLREAMFQGSK